MAKNKSSEKLSPAKYIQTKSRSLPIYECLINNNWDASKLANIIITRKHITGNITLSFYLVDLFCLGVKDSFYKFNIPIEEYLSLKEKIESNSPTDQIEYNLAHNIIFAGYEYALDYGINPCKEFSTTTKYFLEEDDESIEIIDIDCGDENGNPVLHINEFSNPISTKKVIEKLKKNAGEGNYQTIYTGDFDEDDDYFDEDDDEEDYFDDDELFFDDDEDDDEDDDDKEYIDYEEVKS